MTALPKRGPAEDDGDAVTAPDPITPPLSITAASAGQVRREVLDACIVALRHMGGPALTCIGVTSAGRREGRSTIAHAFAFVQAAEYGRKTILAELDLARSSLASRFGLEETPGVAEFLRGECLLEDCLQWPDPKLGVMVAGHHGDGVDQVLTAAMAERVVNPLRSCGEVVVVDLPPLTRGAGGVQLVDLFDTPAMVVKAGGLSRHEIESAVAAFSSPPFVVLNGRRDPGPKIIRRLFRLPS